ncbi:MAG TPA: hypothetical protein VFP26_04670 [Gemmatimonadaceae bacterium]|nr:hypothetical protein [Gemmatimonadaceae bacterium]
MTATPILLSRGSVRERASFTLSARQQKFFAVFLLFHGLAHAGIGMWAGESGRWWFPVALWELAMVGFLAAGFGALGVAGLRDFWRPLTIVGGVASLMLLILTPGAVLVLGLTVDFLALSMIAYSRSEATVPDPSRAKHKVWRVTGIVISSLFLIYVALVLALRTWNMEWGTTPAERASMLPGDEFVPVAHYRIDHGISIDAPTEAVWPWVIQIGQDRGGFYSYTKLENAAGAQITNANQIVREWQTRKVGELVPTVPENYLRGVFGRRLGCKVLRVVPGHALVLEGWGAFVVLPTRDNKTRMLIRTRGEGTPSLAGVVEAPFGLLVFEPAHFIMERAMLIGIKQRAEAAQFEHTFLVSKATR